MAKVESIQIKLSDNEGHFMLSPAESKQFSSSDARTAAMKWAGVVVLVSIFMLPIPLVHFEAAGRR